MDYLKRMFSKHEDDEYAINCDNTDICLKYKIDGLLPYTSTGVFISAFSKRIKCKDGGMAMIAVEYEWFRLVGGKEIKVINNSNSYFFSAFDVHSQVCVRAKCQEDGHDSSPCSITFGPIKLDPSLQMSLHDIVNSDDGYKINLSRVTPGPCTENNQLLNSPHIHFLENHFYIKGRSSSNNQDVTLKFVYSIGNSFLQESQGYRSVRLIVNEDTTHHPIRIFPLTTNTLDIELESAKERDELIVAHSIFSIIKNLRNELILDKIIPLMGGIEDKGTSELMDLYTQTLRELVGVNKSRERDKERIRVLENELYDYRKSEGLSLMKISERKDIITDNKISPDADFMIYESMQSIPGLQNSLPPFMNIPYFDTNKHDIVDRPQVNDNGVIERSELIVDLIQHGDREDKEMYNSKLNNENDNNFMYE